jgi:hypothetical protein
MGEGQVSTVLDEIVINYTSLLWMDAFCPIFSIRAGCAVDCAVQTQLLKVRTRRMQLAPKNVLVGAVEQLLVSYNKLKNRVKERVSFGDICEQVMGELEEVLKLSQKKIFEPGSREQQREMLVYLAEKYLPEIGDLVLQSWTVYLRELKNSRVDQQKEAFLSSLALLIKRDVIRSPLSLSESERREEKECLMDSMLIRPLLLSIHELERQER